MLTFNELRITPDNKHLIIDVSVDSEYYFDNILIDSIVIDNQDTYVPNGPSSTPVYTYQVNKDNYDLTYSTPEDCSCDPILEDEDKSYCFTYGIEHNKNVRLILNTKDLGQIGDNMFFVYVISTGEVTPDTPEGFYKPQIMKAVVDLYPYYQTMMRYIKEVENECEVPKRFIEYSLKLKALELSIRTGNYTQAIKYWNKFFKDKMRRSMVTNCSCYG